MTGKSKERECFEEEKNNENFNNRSFFCDFSEEEVDKLRNVTIPKEKNEMHFLMKKNIQFQ